MEVLSIEVSKLLIPITNFTSPVWRGNIDSTLIENLECYKQERNIHKIWFQINSNNLKYESFFYYLNGKNKSINLKTLDAFSKL